MSIPISQGLEGYFVKVGMTEDIRHTLAMDMQRYLYGKGFCRLHEVFMDVEGKIEDIPNVIRNRDDSTLEELIDTIAEELCISEGTFRHTLISMALRE